MLDVSENTIPRDPGPVNFYFYGFSSTSKDKISKTFIKKNKYACVNPCPLLFVIMTTPARNLSPLFKGGVENQDLLL